MGLRTRSAVLAAGVLAAAASVPTLAASSSAASPKAATPVTVTVKAFEFGFKLSKTKVKRGVPVVFKYTNTGLAPHDFAFVSKNVSQIKGPRKKTPIKDEGGKATLAVTFKKAGSYQFVCTV